MEANVSSPTATGLRLQGFRRSTGGRQLTQTRPRQPGSAGIRLSSAGCGCSSDARGMSLRRGVPGVSQ
jgi:hypothetical protein